jgi:hypothetical protein
VTGAGDQKLASLLGAVGIDEPLLHSCDVHGSVKRPSRGLLLESGYSH